MPLHSFKKQQGAVLAFSLVMLVLLTLASVSIIKQNKVQIAMATNAGQQIATFASVETALRQTQSVLEALRYVDSNGNSLIDETERQAHHCKSGATDSIHLGILPAVQNIPLSNGVNATVVAEHCLTAYNTLIKAGVEKLCMYSAPTVRNLLIGSVVRPSCAYSEKADASLPAPLCVDTPAGESLIAPVPSQENVDACNMLNAAGGWVLGIPNSKACPVEVYTMHVSILDPTTNSQRTIESKFEVDCSSDLNP